MIQFMARNIFQKHNTRQVVVRHYNMLVVIVFFAALFVLAACEDDAHNTVKTHNVGGAINGREADMERLTNDANTYVLQAERHIMNSDSVGALRCIGKYKETIKRINDARSQMKRDLFVESEYKIYIVLSTILFLTSLAGVVFYQYYKKKKLESRVVRQLHERILRNKAQQNKVSVIVKEQQVGAQSRQMAGGNDISGRDNVFADGNVASLKQEHQSMATIVVEKSQLLDESHICRLIKTMLNDKTKQVRNLTEEEWEALDSDVNEIYPEFKVSLIRLCKISVIEYRLCLLLKINVSLSEIAILLNRSKEAVYSSRRRLFKKAFKTDGGASQWDDYIKTL